MTRRALVIAAHGSNDHPEVNGRINELAQACASVAKFDEWAACFHQGQPGFDCVLDQLSADEVVVVPLMASHGYYAGEVLPAKLSSNVRFNQVEVRITSPVGCYPGIDEIVAQRADTICRQENIEKERTVLLLAGHGTRRNAKSRQSVIDLGNSLRSNANRNQGDTSFMEIDWGFIDDEPPLEQRANQWKHENLIVLPMFIGEGPHVAFDVPKACGVDDSQRRHETIGAGDRHRVAYVDEPFGKWSAIEDIVVDLATTDEQSANSLHIAQDVRRTLRLGTRGSKMAIVQANRVTRELRRIGFDVELVSINTSGDRDQATAIATLASESPFSDDIEQSLIDGRIDLAVHSYKDLSPSGTPGLCVAAVLERDDPREALVSAYPSLQELPEGAVVGTSSPRRVAHLKRLREDINPAVIRGPVDARVEAVKSGEFDAAILAVAGLARLDLMHEASTVFSVNQFMPAPAQGALALQVRDSDKELQAALAVVNHEPTRISSYAELEVLRRLESSTGMAVAAYGLYCQQLHLRARVLDETGMLDAEAKSPDVDGAIEAVSRQLERLVAL